MCSQKYNNVMYKSTSKNQDIVSQSIFRVLAENPFRSLESMGMDFNQTTGNCEYNFYFLDYKTVYYILLNRGGKIIESGYTSR